MRFATVEFEAVERPAVIDGVDVVLLPEGWSDLASVIEGGQPAIDSIRTALPELRRVLIDEVRLVAPIRRFRRDILCTGWNYWDHFYESKGKREGQDVDPPSQPTFFGKAPGTAIGPYDDIAYDPNLSRQWDYEAEVAVVIGWRGRSIPEEKALDHVWGYTLANDVSLRDVQRAHGGQWLKGKSIDQTMPLGPWIVTPDELGDPQNVRLECLVNGELRQSASTAEMAFSIARLISELSFGMTLYPGDVLLTGTPSGIGNARDPQLFLQDGDEVVVRAEAIGELCNHVTRAPLAEPS
ncbi:fumarylacetoacetate hydrolase family protein [Kribbella deserti]|uniref:Fumarylacetoacetate hydrolase family protein n=1 Tax=Kribbella deserti TaxID=1926257 RepID=A0ABV6QJ43_9ACTN